MNMKRIQYILLLSVLLCAGGLSASAQVDKSDVRRGNRDFRKEEYREAEIDYRKALVKDSLSVAANYNLANTLYREGDMEQAAKVLETVKEVAPASADAADYYYNTGDVAIARKDWQAAVDAFKESLLRNPADLEAKENYIYARKMLENQQNQDQQNQQNQDQNNDDQNQDQNQNNDNQDQNQNQNNDQQKQPQQGQQPKITPQAAQQMLQAIQAKEKETQDKVNKQKAEVLKSRQKDKNW